MTAIIDFNTVCQYAKIVHYSQMFNTKNEYEAAIIVAMCFQENISFMQFKRDFHFIMGNVSKKADAMLTSFQADGGKKKIIQADENKVIIDFEINGEKYQGVADWEKLQNEPFTRATKDANGRFYAPNVPLANRLIKENYATPIKRGQMLFARCVSDSLRRIYPKACGGYYTPEEVSDFANDDKAEKTAENAAVIPAAVLSQKVEVLSTENNNTAAKPQEMPPAAPKVETTQPPAEPPKDAQTPPQAAQPQTTEDFTVCRIPNAPTFGRKWDDMPTEWLNYASTKQPLSQYFTIHDFDNIKAILKQREQPKDIKADN